MSQVKKYRPSNGTEGYGLMAVWCDRCERDRAFREDQADGCSIVALTMTLKVTDPDYPDQWRYNEDGEPVCEAFIPEGQKVQYRCDKTEDMFDEQK